MPLPTDISTLSTTASSNWPPATEPLTGGDDCLRQWAAFLATLHADKAPVASPTFTGTVTLPGGEAGFRKLVRVASTGETLAATMVGKLVSTSGNMTVPNSTMVAGDGISFYNSTNAALTFTQGSGVTLRLGGTATTGNLSLAAYGLATIYFDTASVAIMSGHVSAA